MDSHLNEVQLDSEMVYEGHFLKIQCDTIRLPDGKQSKREYIRHPGAVVVLALLDDGSILLERQIHKPNQQENNEKPTEKNDPGEDPLACAKRELEEETGY